MAYFSERLDRIEQILEKSAASRAEAEAQQAEAQVQHGRVLAEHEEILKRVDARLDYMAARQQYHDEAFDRNDATVKSILEAISVDAKNISALAAIALRHQDRLDRLDGGTQTQHNHPAVVVTYRCPATTHQRPRSPSTPRVKVEAEVLHPVSIVGFLAKVEPGTRFELEKMPVKGDVWLPKHFSMKADAKVLEVVNHRDREDQTCFNYHKAGQPPG